MRGLVDQERLKRCHVVTFQPAGVDGVEGGQEGGGQGQGRGVQRQGHRRVGGTNWREEVRDFS